MSVKVSFRNDRNRYQVTYWLGGKRYRPLFVERVEADSFARRIRLGFSPESKDSITIEDAGKKYYEAISSKKSRSSRSNDKRYINLMFHFLTYERGIQRLGSVGLEDLEAFRDWLPLQREYDGRPLKMGASTVNRCILVVKHLFKKCVQWKNIPDSPCLYLDLLSSEANERAAMTGDQFRKAYEASEDWFKPVMEFSHLTGAPASCIERLNWEHIDFQSRVFSILRKKGAKARWKKIPIAMTDSVFSLLVSIRNQWPSVEGAVFRDSNGRPLLADRISKSGSRAIKAAGLSGVTMYGMRHALASDLTAANVATEVVRQAMGHQSIATTQRYANKVPLRVIKGAIETVRGGSLVAEVENGSRRLEAGVKVK